jgi:hypothetical protein
VWDNEQQWYKYWDGDKWVWEVPSSSAELARVTQQGELSRWLWDHDEQWLKYWDGDTWVYAAPSSSAELVRLELRVAAQGSSPWIWDDDALRQKYWDGSEWVWGGKTRAVTAMIGSDHQP